MTERSEPKLADTLPWDIRLLSLVDRNDHWLLSLRRYGRKMFGCDKPPYGNAAPPIEGIRRLLSVEGISDLQWLYDAPLR
jgi:hypothetical protein